MSSRAHVSPGARVAVVVILALGALLRTFQFWPRRSLWMDEIMIALNVTGRSAGRLLLEPLDHFQVAPVGFLALSKLGILLLGDVEHGLRLFPFLFGLASLLLFWRVAVRFLDGAPLLAALALFAVSPALVWYAGNAKPYAGDVFATLLLVLVGLRFHERGISDLRGALAWGAAGAACVLLSQPAVLVASAIGAFLVVEAWRGRGTRAAALALVGLWAVGAAIATAASLALAAPETRSYMESAWSNQFLPYGIYLLLWFPERILVVLEHLVFFFPVPMSYRVVVGVLAALAVAGAAFLVRRRPRETLFLAVPVVVAVLAAAVSLLPFGGRAAIYTGPSFLIASMAGISWLASKPWAGRRSATLAAVVAAGVPAVLAFTLARPTYRAEEARPVLEEMRSRWRDGDELYAYYGARYAMEFYGPGLGYRDWIHGNCYRGAPRAYLKELDALRGRPRVWILFTHAYDPYPEPRAMRSYLEAIGTEIDRVEDPFGTVGPLAAEAYLYDLSDPARLARTTADAHPLAPVTGEHEGCVEFPRIEVAGTLLDPGAVEAVVAYLDSHDEESRSRAEAEWGIRLPHPTPVFVLKQENLQRHAGLSLDATEGLVRNLHRRGVAARWCLTECPTRGGDQRVNFQMILAPSRDRLYVGAEVWGNHPAWTFDDQFGLTGWMHRVDFHLRKENGEWVVTHYSVGYFADYGPPASRSRP